MPFAEHLSSMTMSSSDQTSAVDEIRRTLAALFESDAVVELRALHRGGAVSSGYFSDHTRLAQAAGELATVGANIYVTVNAVIPALLARAANRMVTRARVTTADHDIAGRHWLVIDFDPSRPSGISATDDEHRAALDRAQQVRARLLDHGVPTAAIVTADSGNGAHVLVRIDLPNDDASRELLRHVLSALDLLFTDTMVAVDATTFNAARLARVYGTMTRKGDATGDRPHRPSRLLDVPERIETTPRAALERLAAMAPRKTGARQGAGFDVDAWITKHAAQLGEVRSGSWQGGHKWIFTVCPWQPEHTNSSAYIVQFPSGAIVAGCHHNGCADNDWHALRDLVEPGWRNGETPGGAHGPTSDASFARRSQATVLTELAAGAELFRTADGQAFTTVPVADHHEAWPVRSKEFRLWLRRQYYTATKNAPHAQAVQEALEGLEAQALFDSPERPVFVRAGETDGIVYVDLGNERWEVVEISPAGWRVATSTPVKFRRTRGMAPLPTPAPNGSISELRRFVNVATDSDFILLTSWLATALRPRGPYPVLILEGEQGSAKSTTVRVLRALIDPNTAPLRAGPRDIHDLMIAARNGWVVTLDNVSHLPQWLSDALCQLATGGGFATRELYTDTDEIIFHAMRPIMLNGITNPAVGSDLLERAIILSAPPIPPEHRRAEADFWAEFDQACPRILGALLTAIAAALRNRSAVNLAAKPRMADFAEWAVAAAPALGWTSAAFLEAYSDNRDEVTEAALEAAPVASMIINLAAEGAGWAGTATELLSALNARVDEATRRQKDWPGSARRLSGTLRRLAPNFRARAIEIGFNQTTGSGSRKIISIRQSGHACDAGDACDATQDAQHRRASQNGPSASHRAAGNGHSDARVDGVAENPHLSNEAAPSVRPVPGGDGQAEPGIPDPEQPFVPADTAGDPDELITLLEPFDG